MNTESVKSLFALFSGEEETERYAPVIELALRETGLMLLMDADRSDIRLDFLCAAVANYRLQQIKCAQDRRKYTYAGKVVDSGDGSCLASAAQMLRDYMQLCEGLIKPSGFVFFSFGGRRDADDKGSA